MGENAFQVKKNTFSETCRDAVIREKTTFSEKENIVLDVSNRRMVGD